MLYYLIQMIYHTHYMIHIVSNRRIRWWCEFFYNCSILFYFYWKETNIIFSLSQNTTIASTTILRAPTELTCWLFQCSTRAIWSTQPIVRLHGLSTHYVFSPIIPTIFIQLHQFCITPKHVFPPWDLHQLFVHFHHHIVIDPRCLHMVW